MNPGSTPGRGSKFYNMKTDLLSKELPKGLEPAAIPYSVVGYDLQDIALLSIAISLKRLADILAIK